MEDGGGGGGEGGRCHAGHGAAGGGNPPRQAACATHDGRPGRHAGKAGRRRAGGWAGGQSAGRPGTGEGGRVGGHRRRRSSGSRRTGAWAAGRAGGRAAGRPGGRTRVPAGWVHSRGVCGLHTVTLGRPPAAPRPSQLCAPPAPRRRPAGEAHACAAEHTGPATSSGPPAATGAPLCVSQTQHPGCDCSVGRFVVWKWSLDRGVTPAADNEVDDQCRPLPRRRRHGGIVCLSAPRRASPPSFTLLLPRPSRHGRTNVRERATAAAWAEQSRPSLAPKKIAWVRVGRGARVVAGCFQLHGSPLAERAGRSSSGSLPRPPAPPHAAVWVSVSDSHQTGDR